MRRALFLLVGMLAGAAFCGAQTAVAVSDLVQRGLAGNLDLARLQQALDAARKELPWKSELSNTKVSLSGGYDVAAAGGSAKAEASVSVPIVPQLSVAASVSSQGTAGVSVNVAPFTAALTRYKETQTYENALADLTYQTASVRDQIESAAYGVLQAADTLELAHDKYALAEKALEIAEKSYELGGITWDDLENTRKDLTSARQASFDAERSNLAAQVKLYQLMGPTDARPQLKAVTPEEMESAIAARDAELGGVVDRPATTLSLVKALSALKALQAQLKATPTYRPNLSLGARLGYTSSPASSLSGSGTISFSLSASDVQADQRADLLVSIEAKGKEIDLERLSASYQADTAARALDVARAALEGRRASLRQAQSSLDEASLLYEQGERTETELEQTKLSVREAQIALRAAAASVLAAQADILLLHALAA